MEDVKFTIEVNLVGSFNVIKAALPGMKGREGRGPGSISLVSSQAGQVCLSRFKKIRFLFLSCIIERCLL